MSIDNLSIYQLIEVFEYLTLEERLVCRQICRKWYECINYLSIQRLTIHYFTEANLELRDDAICDNAQANGNEWNAFDGGQSKEDRRFNTHILTDKLFTQLGSPLFRKLKNLKIYANSSLQLADSYINLMQLKSLERLQIGNRSLCMCLNMCLERDKVSLANLRYLNLYWINLRILLRHFPNVAHVKCNQIECTSRIDLGDLNRTNQKATAHLPNEVMSDGSVASDENGGQQSNGGQLVDSVEQQTKVKWLSFEQDSVADVNGYVLEFLTTNCHLIEELKINVGELDAIISTIKRLNKLRSLKFNCRTTDSLEFRERILDLIRLVVELNSGGRTLDVEFNGLKLIRSNAMPYNNYAAHQLQNGRFMIPKLEFHTLNYFDLIKIDQMLRDLELDCDDLQSLFNWCRTIHINQNLDGLRALDLQFVNVKQLFFKAFDYDERINDRQLKLLFNKLPNLRSIDLSYVQRLGQCTLDCLPTGWSRLKELSLSSNQQKPISLQFLSGFVELERVELSTCRFAPHTDLDELVKNLKYFTYLNITNCDNLVNIEQLFKTMYTRSIINRRLEYNLFVDKPYSDTINQLSMNNEQFAQRRNFFFIDYSKDDQADVR